MGFLLDPKLFNYTIMALYALNVFRWGINGSWADTGYWLCALGITICVTFGYRH